MLKHKEKHWKLNTHVCLFIIPPEYILSFNTPKKSRTEKNPGIENFKPQKILRSSPALEIPSNPPGWRTDR